MEVLQVSWHRLMRLWQCYPTYSCFLLSAENEVLKLDQTNCTFGFEGKSALYLKYIASCPLYWEQWRWSTLRTKARYCSNFLCKLHMKTHTYASMIMHFSTTSGHTYQNYKQPPQRIQNSDFQSHFSALKIIWIFLIFCCEE